MSRTRKGHKSPGWDYWGRRPLGLGASGKAKSKREQKRLGIKRERQLLKKLAQKDLDRQSNDDDK